MQSAAIWCMLTDTETTAEVDRDEYGAARCAFDDGPPAEAPLHRSRRTALRDLAARLPRTMRLGTSTWNFPGWRGIIWSRGSGLTGLAENGLTAYSKNPLLRTVGLDRNFTVH